MNLIKCRKIKDLVWNQENENEKGKEMAKNTEWQQREPQTDKIKKYIQNKASI